MATDGGLVLLEQSDMYLTLNMLKLDKGEFSRTPTEEMQCLIKNACTDVRDSKMQGVVLPGYRQVKAAIDRLPVMHLENVMDGCHPHQNHTAQYQQTCWRGKGTCTPPPKPMPALPGVPPGNNDGAHVSEIDGVPPRYVYVYIWLPNSQFLNHDAYAMDCKCDQECIPDFLTHTGTTPSYYTVCCMVMGLTSILQTTAANWVSLKVKTRID